MSTIKDVAKESGFSITTVSKVLNNAKDIPDETKEIILDSVKKLNYVPNLSAKNLSSKHKNKIALLMSFNDDNFFIDEIIMNFTSGAFKKSFELEYDTIIIHMKPFIDKNPLYFQNYLLSHGITGILIFGLGINDKMLHFLLDSNHFKKVVLDFKTANNTTSSVSIDNIQAQYDIFKLQYELGKRNFLYVHGSHDSYITHQRLQGVNNFQKNFSDIKLKIINGEFCEKKAVEEVKKLDYNNFDVIICASDLMAIALKRNLTLNITVCGFDGLRLLKYTFPEIVSVYQDFHQTAIIAILELDRLFNGGIGQSKFNSYIIQ